MRKLILALMMGASVAGPVAAQNIEGPIRIIVGFSPGGGVDALARLTAQQLEKELGVSIVVENKPGAGGTLAADYVVRSSLPNSTLLFGDSSLVVAPFIYPSTRYDLAKDLKPIGMVGEATLAIAVTTEHPAKTLQEFLELAKDPKHATAYSSVGVGSLHHLAGELLAQQTGVNLLHVPYRGGAQASQALVSKDVEMAISSIASVMPLVQVNKVRLLGVLSAERFPGLPDVPTVGEVVEGYEATPSLFLMGSNQLNPELAERFEQGLAAATQYQGLGEYFVKQGAVVKYQDEAFFSDWLGAESERWHSLIKNANISFN